MLTEANVADVGLDYTVAHYGILTKDPRMDCVLTFVDDTTPAAAEGWEVGEVGGFEAYLLADEEEKAAAEVYRGVSTGGGGRCVGWGGGGGGMGRERWACKLLV